MTIRKYLIVLFAFATGILAPPRVQGQSDSTMLPSYVTRKDTLVHTRYDTIEVPLYQNALLNISILSSHYLDDDDKFLAPPKDTSAWRIFIDPQSGLSFPYPPQFVVKSEIAPISKNRYFLVGHPPKFSNANDSTFSVFIQIELTSKTFEKEIEDLFSRNGDLWEIQGRVPTGATYIFNSKLKGIAGDQTYGTPSPDGIGTATTASYVCFIYLTLTDNCAAIINYSDDYEGPFLDNILVQIANSAKLR